MLVAESFETNAIQIFSPRQRLSFVLTSKSLNMFAFDGIFIVGLFVGLALCASALDGPGAYDSEQ